MARKDFARARKYVDVSVGQSVRIIRELSGPPTCPFRQVTFCIRLHSPSNAPYDPLFVV